MTTATTARAEQLRDDKAEAERQMGIHFGTPLWAKFMADRGKAVRELRQMEEES